jgi:hypothetical protein
MDILITNIGNRNIKYQGKLYSELESKEKKVVSKLNFREWTKWLFDNFETEKDYIKLNILETVLNQENIKPDKIFVIVSNQESNPDFNGQDTLYEGEIIKRLITSNYQIKDVELKKLTEDVTNENYLMKFYQQFYVELLQKYKDANFIFCDAGGTGQQKTASKIMAEFMIPNSRWKIVYPKQDGSIEEKSQIEYRNIINKEQAISFVRKSQYEAALDILGGNKDEIYEDKTFNLLSFAHFRINRVLDRTEELYSNRALENTDNLRLKNILPERKNRIIKSAVHPEVRNHSESLLNCFSNKTYLFLSESLLASYRKYQMHNYRESILDFAVFYETFIDKSISKIKKEIEKITGEKKSSEDIIDIWINSEENPLPETLQYISENSTIIRTDKINYESIPITVHIIKEQIFLLELKPLANILCPYLDFTHSPYESYESCEKSKKSKKVNSLRDVRNKLAHEGKYLDKKILEAELPYYEDLLNKCLGAWGLATEDIYEELNKMIEKLIRSL